ncbi:RNA polymerase sigma factor (plasmid) [Alicyclobacillus fastidiosus]|uniref:RNA polymerase sigma factor n=1 Tax=Alicyclobacillus fastidiosus TaxID=392011 RepID=A0ABY6ZRP7_9BACL|nr:RNA polymerase sigma factor [Alicyclobacillus fastidiosus]WAH44774.1 RNA polymerase sigma factor [Alicyclobacillus fastidiosus]
MSSELDRDADLRDLYELYRHDIYRFARYTLGDSSVALDVVQEVFVRAIRAWGNFRHDANTKTWLLSIARNYMYDYVRKQKKWNQFISEYDPPFIADRELPIETTLVLEQTLMALKESYRQVFILRHIEELSVEETAQVLGWSPGKVRTTDYRAVARIRNMLGTGFEGGNS